MKKLLALAMLLAAAPLFASHVTLQGDTHPLCKGSSPKAKCAKVKVFYFNEPMADWVEIESFDCSATKADGSGKFKVKHWWMSVGSLQLPKAVVWTVPVGCKYQTYARFKPFIGSTHKNRIHIKNLQKNLYYKQNMDGGSIQTFPYH